MFKWLGLLLVFISWLVGFYLIRAWPGKKTISISKHAASSKGTTKLFGATLIVGGAASYFWLTFWFTSHLNLGVEFIALLTLAFGFQIITGLIPDSNTRKSKLHRIAAFSMNILYLPLSLLIVSSHSVGRIDKIIGIFCLAYMVISALLFLSVKRVRKHYLAVQALYIIAFQVIILSSAYLK